MARRIACVTAALLITSFTPAQRLLGQQSGDRFWAQWRGPFSTGVSRTATPPVEWSETRNIRWKVSIPGRSSSTPITRDRVV